MFSYFKSLGMRAQFYQAIFFQMAWKVKPSPWHFLLLKVKLVFIPGPPLVVFIPAIAVLDGGHAGGPANFCVHPSGVLLSLHCPGQYHHQTQGRVHTHTHTHNE